MEPSSGIRTWQWVVTVVIIIVLIIIGVIVFGGKDSGTPTDNGTATTSNTVGSTVNRVTMTDQYPGNVVYISSVQLAKPGWVVVHKDNKGQLGDAIGQTYLAAGINPAKVNLTAATMDGQMYYVVLHNDDGDGKFDATKDLPLKDANGNIIMKPFKATTDASIEIKG